MGGRGECVTCVGVCDVPCVLTVVSVFEARCCVLGCARVLLDFVLVLTGVQSMLLCVLGAATGRFGDILPNNSEVLLMNHTVRSYAGAPMGVPHLLANIPGRRRTRSCWYVKERKSCDHWVCQWGVSITMSKHGSVH